MTVDLKTQIRDYTEFFSTSVDPIEMEEILHETVVVGPIQQEDHVSLEGSGALEPLPLIHRRRPTTAAVALAAAIVVLLLVGVVAFLNQGSASEPDVINQGSLTTITVVNDLLPVSADSTLGTWTWTPVGVSGSPLIYRSLKHDGDYFATSDLSRNGASIWRSTDGITWESEPILARADTNGWAFPDTRLVEAGSQLFWWETNFSCESTGPRGSSSCELGSEPESRLFRLTGDSWVETELPAPFRQVVGPVENSDRLLIAGSTDGGNWTLAYSDDDGATFTQSLEAPWAVALPGGQVPRLLSTGAEFLAFEPMSDSPIREFRIWASANGLEWEAVHRLRAPASMGTDAYLRTSWQAGDLIYAAAVDESEPRNPVIQNLVSEDGRVWQLIDIPSGGRVLNAEATEFGWIARASFPGSQTILLISADGKQWEEIPLPFDLTTQNFRFKLDGAFALVQDADGVEWIGRLDD